MSCDLVKLVNELGSPKVLVVGDVILDRYTWGDAERVSQEAPVILLREAKNVTYKSFVKPGYLLRVEVTCRKLSPDHSDFEGAGFCGEAEVVRGRFGLTHFSAAQRRGLDARVDGRLISEARAGWARLNQ